MTYSESLVWLIERQERELRFVLDGLSEPRGVESHADGWDVREILLHLLGDAKNRSQDLDRSSSGDAAVARQTGGEYVDVPELRTTAEAGAELIRALDVIVASVRHLDDAALSAPVRVMRGEGGTTFEVPLGIVIRHSLTDHFDEHLAQLRVATGQS
jgi:hypothetical protein